MASSSNETTPSFCGPEDPCVLYLQPHHVSASIMSGNEADSIQCRKLDNNIFQAPMHYRVLEHIERMRFGGVYNCGKPKPLDSSLIGALIERWRPETHTFHLPVGEATVTLQDIEVLWGLRVDGDAVILPQVNHPNSYWIEVCGSLLGITPSDAGLKLGGFTATTLKNVIRHRLDDDLAPHIYMQYARIYVLLLLGCLIIPDTSGRKIPFHHILLLVDEDQASQLSWGIAALATLYIYLCEASCEKRKEIGGPLALLQMWAWERIPNIRPELVGAEEYDGTTPCASIWTGRLNVGFSQSYFREQLAHLHDNQFIWEPYLGRPLPEECRRGMAVWGCTIYLIAYHIVEPYMGHRVQRQFGMPQRIFPNETRFHNFEN